MNSSSDQTSLTPTFIRFALAFVLCVIIVQVAIAVLNMKMPSSMGIITFVVALAPAVDLFTRSTGRVMTTGEKLRFALVTAIIAIGINVATLFLLTYVATNSFSLDTVATGVGLGKIDPLFMAIVVGVGLVLAFVIAYFSAGFMGRGALKRLAKAQQS